MAEMIFAGATCSGSYIPYRSSIFIIDWVFVPVASDLVMAIHHLIYDRGWRHLL
ncbi:uncharacterized protein BDW47DRAFT_106965 [Aspergillus candidus]|uniref:Uncharacterized protein n=1 Tax=Aspergillus candidus TaxID=41067 RepID=A0A2I2F9T7_ASPCN|nr:hypothetical protein BDW47DRAFT_106965 [Aspergillus candidus]PLB37391.1 hypothetical protein BDW47DRAFT_106965 [Aspergillus candidus]